MSPNPDDVLTRMLNEAFGNLNLGTGSRQVSYRYWRLKAHAAGNRREEWYAYGTQRSKGPDGVGTPGYWSWVWVWTAPNGPTHRQVAKVGRAVRCATRRRAKNVAYRRFLSRKGEEPRDFPVSHRIPRLTPEQRAALDRNLAAPGEVVP